MASTKKKAGTNHEETPQEPEPPVIAKPSKKYIKRKVVNTENKKTSDANDTLQSSEVAGANNIKNENPNTGKKKKRGRRLTDDDQNHQQLHPEDEHDAKDPPNHEDVFEHQNNDLKVKEKPLITSLLPGYEIDEELAEEVEGDLTRVKNVHIVKETHQYKSKHKEVKEVNSFDARTAMDMTDAAIVPSAAELHTNNCPVCEEGWFERQDSFMGYLACIILCPFGGPFWCRKACSNYVCNRCGASKF